MLRFIVKVGEQGETSFFAQDQDIFIGRVQSINDVCINDPSISRQHAHVKFKDGQYTIYDLKSMNGVILNGKRVSRAKLKHGDQIKLGIVIIEVQLRDYTADEAMESIEQSEVTIAEVDSDLDDEVTLPVDSKHRKKQPKKS